VLKAQKLNIAEVRRELFSRQLFACLLVPVDGFLLCGEGYVDKVEVMLVTS
jgi:hypothetical protein